MNRKHRAFVCEYLKDFNATQAAIRAGYSPNCADVTGARVLGNASVSAAIEKAQNAAVKASHVTLSEAKDIASEIARDAQAQRRDRLAALDRLAKFDGWDSPTRHDHTSGGQPIRTEIVLVPSGGEDDADE
ncbi:MAG: terminase small subunit [Leptolyngbya sp.]|nr:terminase small subunit [Leptolyngbya sp.]